MRPSSVPFPDPKEAKQPVVSQFQRKNVEFPGGAFMPLHNFHGIYVLCRFRREFPWQMPDSAVRWINPRRPRCKPILRRPRWSMLLGSCLARACNTRHPAVGTWLRSYRRTEWQIVPNPSGQSPSSELVSKKRASTIAL